MTVKSRDTRKELGGESEIKGKGWDYGSRNVSSVSFVPFASGYREELQPSSFKAKAAQSRYRCDALTLEPSHLFFLLNSTREFHSTERERFIRSWRRMSFMVSSSHEQLRNRKWEPYIICLIAKFSRRRGKSLFDLNAWLKLSDSPSVRYYINRTWSLVSFLPERKTLLQAESRSRVNCNRVPPVLVFLLLSSLLFLGAALSSDRVENKMGRLREGA